MGNKPKTQANKSNAESNQLSAEEQAFLTEEIKKLPLTMRMRLAAGRLLPEQWRKKLEESMLKRWQNIVITQEKELLAKAREDKDKAIKAIMMFNAIYVLEDESGEAYDEERLEELSHEELVEMLEFYLNELKKDVGGEE